MPSHFLNSVVHPRMPAGEVQAACVTLEPNTVRRTACVTALAEHSDQGQPNTLGKPYSQHKYVCMSAEPTGIAALLEVSGQSFHS